jgi:undecaprenyl-diphosphatase
LDPVKAVVLGIIQGATEFLPVSSSAHLNFLPQMLGWGDPGVAFTAVIQLGTMAAVLAYFRKDLLGMGRALLRSLRPGGTSLAEQADDQDPTTTQQEVDARLARAVLLGTIPIVVAGLALKGLIETAFRDLRATGIALIVMAVVLYVADRMGRKSRPLEDIRVKDGWLVGAFQALALLPGVSRSGATLTGAFLGGLDRAAAARFSFLLSVPSVVLAGLFELKDIIKPKPPEPGVHVMHFGGADMLLATIVAGVVGYLSIAFLMNYLKKRDTLIFVIYRIAVGVLILYLVSSGRLAPR